MSTGRKKSIRRPIGLGALLIETASNCPFPLEEHYAGGSRREVHRTGSTDVIIIPSRKAPQSNREHLEYAMRYEALDLHAWYAITWALGPEPFLSWVLDEPTGRHARRAWYLYEQLTNDVLPVPDSRVTNYVPLADASLQLTSTPIKSARHRIANNLLGGFEFCPLVRMTDRLRESMASDLKQRVQSAVADIDTRDLQRATDYLYHKETKASFQIEREDVSPSRMERFVSALRAADTTRWYEEAALTNLQNSIVDPRYREKGYRLNQVYVGQTMPWGEERVHYPCPKPEDVPSLMRGWQETLRRTVSTVHPVCQAAIVGFGFVFIHPFEDGNGRLHRFVIHATLTRRHFAPTGVVIPVSATMLRKREAYDAALEAFSRSVLQFIEYALDEDGQMTVEGETRNLYRFWDATPQCEYLFDALRESVEVDLPEELRALRAYDAGRSALVSIIDMPDRKADLLMRLLLQNGYRLSSRKRDRFPELTDDEIDTLERAIREAAENANTNDQEQASLPF